MIGFSKSSDLPPLNQFRIEIFKPCMESLFFQSGLNGDDNSIYSIYDFGWAEEGFNTGEQDFTLYSHKVDFNRRSRCPLDKNSGQYFDPRYTASSSDLGLSLYDIRVENSLNNVMTWHPYFDYDKVQRGKTVYPQLWTRPPIYIKKSCGDFGNDMEQIIKQLRTDF